MARLIPNRSTCLPRMWPGEKRFALRLEDHLDEDYIVWYDVPIGPKRRHPDFLILHPNRGVLILEVKDWKLETIVEFDRIHVTLATDRGHVHESNPLAQARSYAHELNSLLRSDSALLNPSGHAHVGKLVMPYDIGVVLANITRAQFDANEFGNVLPSHKVICRDEMIESVDGEVFERRLWAMFDTPFPCRLTLPQIDRFRYHVFPELRIPRQPCQGALFPKGDDKDTSGVPDIIRIMDLTQEQLARSLGDGHRVIHGVAGSGKTMILGYRCLHLARTLEKPILVLCYNKPLAARLQSLISENEITDRVTVRNFDSWCVEMLTTYRVPKPSNHDRKAFFEGLAPAVIAGVESNAIPRGQYGAILIDEGHDFRPEWLKLIAQMVDPTTNSLLLLYDDAQSIYARNRQSFSFASVGIEARGRTTILKLNYRNTLEVLATARAFADAILQSHESDEDGVPLIAPQSAGRRGAVPELIRCSTIQSELSLIVARIRDEAARGRPLSDIAVLCRDRYLGQSVAARLERESIANVLVQTDQRDKLFSGSSSVKIMTLHISKGLEFGLVFIPGLCSMPHASEDEADEARLLYVGITRALDRLVMSHHKDTAFTTRMHESISRTQAQLAAA